MSSAISETISTKIWDELPEADNSFAAARCYCSGFDVYGDLLKNATYTDYLYLLFKLEPPNKTQSTILQGLAIALANLGPRDHAVRAAMSAGVGGSTHASSLIAALSVGAGNLGGAREVFHGVEYWQACGPDIKKWSDLIADPPTQGRMDVWLPMEHIPGFDPNGVNCPTPVIQTLEYLANANSAKHLKWLLDNRSELEALTGNPLAFSGVAAAACYELELQPEQAEMLFLLLRLPGAAVHALEQEKLGWRKYPFFSKGFKVTE
jgi:citrate synthase